MIPFCASIVYAQSESGKKMILFTMFERRGAGGNPGATDFSAVVVTFYTYEGEA